MKAYKGFNKNDNGTLQCRSFIYEEGKTYKKHNAILCYCGFHACLDPLDCLKYYVGKDVVYHEVELDGVSEERENDSKVVAKKITIGKEISLDEMCKISVAEFPDKYKQPRMIILQNYKYCYIKSNGTRLNDEEYDYACSFHEGFACVYQNNKWHFIKADGTRMNDDDYDYVYDFNEGFALVNRNGKLFHINTKGERVD